MVAGVTDDQVTRPGQCRDGGGIGGIAAGKDQGVVGTEQISQADGEGLVNLRVAADQRAGPGPGPLAAGSLCRCFHQPRVTGIAEVVVGPAIDEAPAIEADRTGLPSGPQPPGPQQFRGGKGVEFVFDPVEARR